MWLTCDSTNRIYSNGLTWTPTVSHSVCKNKHKIHSKIETTVSDFVDWQGTVLPWLHIVGVRLSHLWCQWGHMRTHPFLVRILYHSHRWMTPQYCYTVVGSYRCLVHTRSHLIERFVCRQMRRGRRGEEGREEAGERKQRGSKEEEEWSRKSEWGGRKSYSFKMCLCTVKHSKTQ